MRNNQPKIILLLTAFALLLSACSGGIASANDDLSQRKIRVVATTGMIGDIVKNVGGERVDVEVLMGPGIDPHLYRASEGDVHAIEKADIIFYNGLHLEAGMAFVFERMQEWKRIVAVTDTIDRSELHAPPEFKGAYDPHVWFDVRKWMKAVEVARDSLVELDPASSQLYEQNALAYLAELEALDAYVHEQAGKVPADKRVIITAHDAFNYFGESYGFEVRGLQGISTASEAGTGDVQALAQLIVEREIPALFVETSVPQRNIEAIQAAVRARGFNVRVGGALFSDAMGSPGTPEGTYIGMVRHNIDTIVNALLAES